jgi:hypothetical protein
MDNPSTFDNALQQYVDAYVRVNMARAAPNTLDAPRNAILAQLDRLQKIIDSENAEIKNFADKARMSTTEMAKTAAEARSLRSQRGAAADDLTLTRSIVGDTPPKPDWSPLYRRIGIVGGLLIVVLAVRMLKV